MELQVHLRVPISGQPEHSNAVVAARDRHDLVGRRDGVPARHVVPVADVNLVVRDREGELKATSRYGNELGRRLTRREVKDVVDLRCGPSRPRSSPLG